MQSDLQSRDSTKLANNEAWQDLLFGVRKSIRYHVYRRKFFDRISMIADFLIIVSGGTVLGFSASDAHWWAAVFGALVSIIGSFDLVIGFSNKARDHHDLAREFSGLERRMIKIGDSPTQADYVDCYDRRLEIEEEEPPVIRVLDCYCHNELNKALGKPEEEEVEIDRFQRFLRNCYDLHPETCKKKKDINKMKSGA